MGKESGWGDPGDVVGGWLSGASIPVPLAPQPPSGAWSSHRHSAMSVSAPHPGPADPSHQRWSDPKERRARL